MVFGLILCIRFRDIAPLKLKKTFTMIYSIYHPISGSMNHFCEPAQYEYALVFSLEAGNLDEAFKLCQNDFNEEYTKLGIRSTSVGDIIQGQRDYESGTCHLVKGIGFQEVSNMWLSFIDWGNHIEETIPEPWDHHSIGC